MKQKFIATQSFCGRLTMTKGETRILELNDITADLMGAGLLKIEVEKPKSEPKAKPKKEPTAKETATKKKTIKKKSTTKKKTATKED